MIFRLGQKVVRVEYDTTYEGKWAKDFTFTFPEVGKVVTIKTINHWPHWTLLTFYEHDNSHLLEQMHCQIEPGFDARHFRPLVVRKTDISLFTKMLTDARSPALTS